MPYSKDPERRNARTAEAAAKRKEQYLALRRSGKDRQQAQSIVGLGPQTVTIWRRDPEFKRLEQEAEALVVKSNFPDFLTWRIKHSAYYDRRKGIHPVTGKIWVNRAVNSFFQEDATENLESHNRLIVVMPPAHIKTTFFAIERSVYDIMRDRAFRLTAVQKSQPEARKLIGAVKERLSDHGYYHELAELLQMQGDLPIECPLCAYEDGVPFKPENLRSSERWSADAIKVAGASSGEKDYTMEAKGYGSQIQGVRADRIVIDDLQDPMIGMKNPADAVEKLDWLQAVILGRVFDYQQVIILGNYFAPDDFCHVAAAKLDWPVVEYPAILTHDRRNGRPLVKPKVLSPETWNLKALEAKRKEVGEQVWHFTWQQEEGSFDRQTFKREILEASRNLSLALGDIPTEVTDVFIGVDPATAATGYCAMICLGLNRKTGDRYLIDVFNQSGMLNWDRVIDQIEAWGMKYHPRWIVVEGNNTQKGFINSEKLRDAVRRTGAKLDIYQTVTGTGARSESTNFDITTIGSQFDAAKVTLPYGGDVKDRKKVDDLITQFCMWRTDDHGHSIKHLTRDQVMAWLFAESKAFEVEKRPQVAPVQNSKAPRFAARSFDRFRKRAS